MKLKPNINDKTGLYVGTEIDEKWWKRCTEDKLLTRGNGEYWNDDQAFYFLRYFIKEPIKIPYEKITGFRVGKWHSGKWCFGYPILKIIWLKNNHRLSSGFLVSKQEDEVENFVSELESEYGKSFSTPK